MSDDNSPWAAAEASAGARNQRKTAISSSEGLGRNLRAAEDCIRGMKNVFAAIRAPPFHGLDVDPFQNSAAATLRHFV